MVAIAAEPGGPLGLAAIVTVAGLASAAAEGKKKRKAPASTRSASAALAAGGTATAPAACNSKKDAAPRKK
jgi:hypothetical protein